MVVKQGEGERNKGKGGRGFGYQNKWLLSSERAGGASVARGGGEEDGKIKTCGC